MANATTPVIQINEGNVGIGTTSPGSKLEVSSGAGANGDSILTISADTDNSTSSSNPKILMLQKGNTKTSLIEMDSSNRTHFSNGDGHYFSGGNVGIGNTSPDFRLHTNLDLSGSPLAYLNGTSNTFDATANLGVTHNSTAVGTGTAAGVYLANNANDDGAPSPIVAFSALSASGTYNHTYAAIYGIKTAGGADTNWVKGDLTFATGNTTGPERRMTIDSTGNVGIGTTSPDTKLHVEGNVLIDAYNQGEDNGLFFREGFLTIDQPSITVWDMSNSGASPDGLSINSWDGIRFRESGGEVARFKDGNFGIGTTSPQSGGGSARWLSLNGTAAYSGGVVYTIASTTKAYSYFESDYLKQQAQTGFGQKFIVNGTNTAMTILSSGNVGINITNPQAKLDIVSANLGGAINNTSTQAIFGVSNANYSNLYIQDYRTTAGTDWTSSGKRIQMRIDTTYMGYMQFNGTGNNGGISFGTGTSTTQANVTEKIKILSSGATTFTSTVTATNFILSSDERLKENIEKACDNRIKADWKTFELKTDKGQKRYGVIAQELEKTNPEFVREDTQGFKSVAYIDLLIAKIAELEARLEKAGI